MSTCWLLQQVGNIDRVISYNYKGDKLMPSGKKRKRMKMATHKRKKKLRKNRQKKKK